MDNIVEITSLTHPGTEVYGTLTEAQLRNRLEPEKGIVIVAVTYTHLRAHETKAKRGWRRGMWNKK